MNYKILKQHKCFEGKTLFCEHESKATKTTMKFSVFLPCEVENIDSAIIWLSGLTCTDENFITKAGAQRVLANTKTMIICPDTSPRGLGIEGEDDSYDFGTGAGFYVNATTPLYKNNYQMYDYVNSDIVSLLKTDFGADKVSIMGHSMGGHGALVIGLRNSETYKSISAFSPIVNPMNCDWGVKAFNGYLGEDKDSWKIYDSVELIKTGSKSKNAILVDQGTNDEFLENQLKTAALKNACSEMGQEVIINMRDGYDHSYYFISSFIEDHIKHHLKYL